VNRLHLEYCGGEEWRQALADRVIPFAMSDTELGDDALEVGPGPGLVTDYLRERVKQLTVIELDEMLADALRSRLVGSNVDVVQGDATAMPFTSARFTGAASFTMLHHVPTAELQDKLFAEVARVLKPGAAFVASDSLAREELRGFHEDDIYNPIDPATLERRLQTAGFASAEVRVSPLSWAVTARR
jgi:ubiquinone/menaquinone biosynthesis C-methylase UbiE